MMKILNKIISLKYFSIYLKVLVLFLFFLIIYMGFQGHSTSAAFLKHLRNFNLGNLVVWSYWWPFLVISSIFFGRVWCMMCPVELATTFASKLGLKQEHPRWLKSGWVITILYSTILFVGINGFAIHRNPKYMAIYLLILLVLSIIVGFIFKKNAFCRYVCPIGILLGVYSRFSFLGWRVKSLSTCNSCKDKSCISKKNVYKIDDKSCGVNLYPAKITTNEDCILCGGCRKACKNNNIENNPSRPNPGFEIIKPKQSIFSGVDLSYSQVAFTLLLSGFIIYEILSEWTVTKGYLMYVPNILTQKLDLNNALLKGLIKSICLFVILPLLIWVIPFLFSTLLKVKLSFGKYLRSFATGFIPIMAAAHVCKALLKTLSRLPYFEHILNDVSGMHNTQVFLDGYIALFKIPIAVNVVVSVLMLILLLLGSLISVYAIKRTNKLNNYTKGYIFYLIPIMYSAIFIIPVVLWRFL